MSFKSPALIVIFIISLALALGWFFYSRNQDGKKTDDPNTEQAAKISNLTNSSPADFDAMVKKQYSTAKTKAESEDQDLKLASIEVTIGSDLQNDNVNSRYIFSSEEDSKNNWMITFSNASGNFIRAKVPKDDYAGNLQQINTALWKFNFVTAMQLAEKNGGLEFREKNTDFSGIKLTLKHSGSKNWLLWIVEYSASKNSKSIQIDANSGKLVE